MTWRIVRIAAPQYVLEREDGTLAYKLDTIIDATRALRRGLVAMRKRRA